MSLRIPGNILLLGEYAILETGSIALTAAIFPLALTSINSSSILTGERGDSKWEYDLERSSENNPEGNLFASCWIMLKEYASEKNLLLTKKGVHINTSSFLSDKGKIGFGSSAASAVSCIKGVLEGQIWGDSVSISDFQKIAFKAHNAFQGKIGSGYDVYTSCSSRLNLFTKGFIPSIEKVHLFFLPDVYVYDSPHSVSTISAVKKYNFWKNLNPDLALDFIKKSNLLTKQFCALNSWKEGQIIFNEAKELGLYLGEQIGVSAEVRVPEQLNELSDTVWKASGAGNELPIILSPHDLTPIDGIHKVIFFDE
ncbi:MAG: hypothetical protein PF518_00960 [Spirochaetaceae bacterium]|nr:hypothetical protein [Spirochaetaceae bacterium]